MRRSARTTATRRCPESQLREPAARAVDELQRALAIYRGCAATGPQALVLLNLLEALWQLGWAADDDAAAARRLDDLDGAWRELSGLPVPEGLADDVARWRERLDAAHAAG
ncbi:MAG: hypothetical protein MUF40_00825 [Gemmatimonadaceae bacterium]|nr:hypothetical protein [Gemmatimonadaceae bacterium]